MKINYHIYILRSSIIGANFRLLLHLENLYLASSNEFLFYYYLAVIEVSIISAF